MGSDGVLKAFESYPKPRALNATDLQVLLAICNVIPSGMIPPCVQ